MQPFGLCDFLGFLLVTYCSTQQVAHERNKQSSLVVPESMKNTDRFVVEFEWSHINYTWKSSADYKRAIATRTYVPENNALVGVKFYEDKMYLALPRLRPGTPVTLAYVPLTNAKKAHKRNLLLVPFPSWKMNAQSDCATLQNVQSMEIDRNGIMWVLDGTRINEFARSCPTKLLLLDLKNNGKVIHVHVFANELSSSEGGFLNDLVVDEDNASGGDTYAYITETSDTDPGLIVYSRLRDKAWKLRDRTMHAEPETAALVVDGLKSNNLVPIDGIALDPVSRTSASGGRSVYYSPLTGYNLYAISTVILRNEQICKSGIWRRYIKLIGRKQGQSDGMAMDNKGNLHYGLLEANGVAKWNVYRPFNESKVVDRNEKTLIWPDSFAHDGRGFLYVLANGINKFFNPFYPLQLSAETKFRVLRLYTGNKSYLYE